MEALTKPGEAEGRGLRGCKKKGKALKPRERCSSKGKEKGKAREEQ